MNICLENTIYLPLIHALYPSSIVAGPRHVSSRPFPNKPPLTMTEHSVSWLHAFSASTTEWNSWMMPPPQVAK